MTENTADKLALNQNVNAILHLWFGEDAADIVEDRGQLWFAGGAAIDQQIQAQFSQSVIAAANGELSWWQHEPKSCLALILLLDQFTRNIFRGTAKAFASDALVVDICKTGLASAFDKQLTLSQRVFFYLPLEHSESLADQELCVTLFTELAEDAAKKYGEQYQKLFAGYIDYAVDHRNIILKYGRFPHRNKALDLTSTQAELDYLNQGGTSFGQDDSS